MTPEQLVAAVQVALDDTERIARAMHTQTCGHDAVDADVACDCDWHVAAVLRRATADRDILALYEFVTSHGPAVDHIRAMDMTTGAESALLDVVRALARGLGIDPEDSTP